MRKTLRILYLACIAFLLFLFIAVCLSFSGTVTSFASATGSSSENVLVQTTTTLDWDTVFFSLSHWEAKAGKTYQCLFDPSSLSLTLLESNSESSLEFGGNQGISLHLCAIFGFVIFSSGLLLSMVGRNSKTASGIGTGFLLAGSVLFFLKSGAKQGIRYEMFFATENSVDAIFKISAPWINLWIISPLASGLSLIHFIFLLKSKPQMR